MDDPFSEWDCVRADQGSFRVPEGKVGRSAGIEFHDERLIVIHAEFVADRLSGNFPGRPSRASQESEGGGFSVRPALPESATGFRKRDHFPGTGRKGRFVPHAFRQPVPGRL